MDYWHGQIGTGKTTQAVARLESWLKAGVPPQEVLILVPTRILNQPYLQLLTSLDIPNVMDVSLLTFTGLVQRGINRYWTQIAPYIMPNWDGRPPTYLTIETAQYYMAQWVEPLYQHGRFEAVHLDRPRLIAQIINNLSASAVNQLTLEEVQNRLIGSWVGQSNRIGVYQAAMEAAVQFRTYCDSLAILDFSRQVDIFMQIILPSEAYQADLAATYKYAVCDNLEEHYPVVFDFLRVLLPKLDSSLLVSDDDAGYRIFLGASPEIAATFEEQADEVIEFNHSLVQSEILQSLDTALSAVLDGQPLIPDLPANPREAFTIEFSTFYPQMLDWVVGQTVQLVKKQQVPPSEIVILAPFLGDALRFSILNGLEKEGIPFVSHRPSRSLRDEPLARAILTAMKLAYTAWEKPPLPADITQMLVQFIAGLDPIRADLLTQILYRPPKELGQFERIVQPMQERITYQLGEQYDILRNWLLNFQAVSDETPPDHFIHQLFELLTHAGFGFVGNLEAGRIASHLIDSAAHFRSVMFGAPTWGALSAQFIELVGNGVLAGQPTRIEQPDAVFIAPAYTFLMQNRFVDYQLWVDVGSTAWFERIEQPVTHPYVLRRTYPQGLPWTDDLEMQAQAATLRHLILGLTRRCRQHLFLAFADLGEQGYEQRGYLLRLFNQLMGFYSNASLS